MARGTMRQFLDAGERGIAWIAAQQRSDGSFCNPEDGVGSYYKVPYALALAGRLREALLLVSWVAEHHFTTKGDFRAHERKAHEPAHDAWPVYSNAWLVQGAHRVGRWDLSMRGAEFILRHQVPVGGFYALDGETRYLEPVCTSWAGWPSSLRVILRRLVTPGTCSPGWRSANPTRRGSISGWTRREPSSLKFPVEEIYPTM